MGRLLGLLALLNVLMLAAGGSLEAVRAKPATLPGFNADKVRLLGRAERTEAPPAKAVEPVESVNEATRQEQAPRCLSWLELDAVLLSEIDSRMKSAGIAATDYDMSLSKRLGWWVYLPPFADAEAMRDAIEAARRKGIKDIAQVRGGDLVNAVSLGAFPSLAKARAQEKRLRTLGLEGMRIGPRPNSGTATLTIADKVAAANLAALSEGWGKGRAPVACEGN